MGVESVLMFPLFLYSIKLLLHSLEPLLVLLLHLRSHGAAHLLLNLGQLVHHVPVLHPTLAHALAAHHVLPFTVHSPTMHLGNGNSGSHNQNCC